jgi:hypothetical protein
MVEVRPCLLLLVVRVMNQPISKQIKYEMMEAKIGFERDEFNGV